MGIQLDNLFDAFHERRNNLRVIHTRHEQGAAFMAMGYAQASGRTGVFAVVPGPGLLNSLTALATGASANLPMLCLTGQIPSYQIGQGLGIAHELKDQMAVARGVIEWVRRAEHPAAVPALLADAFQHMHSGRKSPAVFEMAPDLLGQKAPVEPVAPLTPHPAPVPDAEAIAQAARRLAAAKRPLILVGGEYKQINSRSYGAGLVSTAGGLVFAGDDQGFFTALDAETGEPLWHFNTGIRISASPIAYAVGGRQYLAVCAGVNVVVFALPEAKE